MDFFSYPEFVFEQFSGSSFELPQLNIATKSKSLARNFLISVMLSVFLLMFVILVAVIWQKVEQQQLECSTWIFLRFQI